jgi:hypothetical protein
MVFSQPSQIGATQRPKGGVGGGRFASRWDASQSTSITRWGIGMYRGQASTRNFAAFSNLTFILAGAP